MSTTSRPYNSHTFHVHTDELDCQIYITPSTKPLWRGEKDYGTLSIFKAEIDPPDSSTMAFIFVIENSSVLSTLEDPKNYRCNYVVFENVKVSYTSLIYQLLTMIQQYVDGIVISDIEDRKFNGTYSLQ